MNGFNRFYLWGLKMKYHMGIYTVAGIFFKAIANALQEVYSVDTLTMLEMLVMILEGAMVAILYAMWLEKRWDTKNLNRSLQKFQEK